MTRDTTHRHFDSHASAHRTSSDGRRPTVLASRLLERHRNRRGPLIAQAHSLIVVCAALGALSASARAGTIAVTPVSSGATSLSSPQDGTRGWRFNVNSDINVTHLGVFDDLGNGINSIPVAIWSSGASLLTSDTLTNADPLSGPVVSGPGFNGQFRYHELASPLTLTPGIYFIGADMNGSRVVFDAPSIVVGDANITPQPTAHFAGGTGLAFPSSGTGADVWGYFGPNFQYEVVPEPSTLVLAGCGLVGLAWVGLRSRRRRAIAAPACLAIALAGALPAMAVSIPTVPVGNADNAGELSGAGAGGFGPDATVGGVAYDYRIGTTEVTNAQYAAFLNAKAASDPLALYNTSMASGLGGITRSGSDGSYTYTPIAGREDMPVNYVNWYDAVRFANWLHNGQGTGDTETGAYTLLGDTPIPSNGLSITRNSGALWFLTSEDEWYKAAYHKNDGATGNYFDYPTSSDTTPIDEAPPGGSNSANYDLAVGDLTIGGAYASMSPYGTFDQGGNVYEWTEALLYSSARGVRGGSWDDDATNMLASYRNDGDPASEGRAFIGFRVATIPEPSALVLAGCAALGLLVVAARRRAKGLARAMMLLAAGLLAAAAPGLGTSGAAFGGLIGDTYIGQATNLPNTWGPSVLTIDGVEELVGGPGGAYVNEAVSPFAGIPGGIATDGGVISEFEQSGTLLELQLRTADGGSFNDSLLAASSSVFTDIDTGFPTTVVANTLYFYFLKDGVPLTYPALYGAGEEIGTHPLNPAIPVFYDLSPNADLFVPDGKLTLLTNEPAGGEYSAGALEAATGVSPINGVRIGVLLQIVPEPSALALAVCGSLGAIWLCLRRRRAGGAPAGTLRT